ncbi:class I SAM-dependent methyltransferase [Rhodoblastus acidophilus]|uniref:Class I SAM-dependent methyltransferase n=1 Tax=Candidatus Rhodoblastus alkanivorans TaxID=2954117 RepID=A0ABS9Z559_9HYPH|nr:class I SAM-dependent methyltransferase [Candidatus Rhodoblastus alkanivorans]MCI4680648.1 class I SAM-dependent methyltransferase [Candidatus Rhodoblastus alkanivorans]MCI4682520.1 class I SAM-dependent methyltransferase [Candidatus Rhodoblastus alkanivorans]MDI4639826.1 class I SAM-dependent methyltransferase [Rhodoblastus acidophilus]
MSQGNHGELKKQFRNMARAAQTLGVAYIGVVNGLFTALHSLGKADADALAAAAGMDPFYVRRWCDAAYAFDFLEAGGDSFRLSETGAAIVPTAPGTLMPFAAQTVLNLHMAERAAELMRTGARPGEQVLAERATLLPWFGPMLEANFATFFEQTICPGVPFFAEVDRRGGLAVDLGCGNGWYLRALARRCGALRGLGIDGFEENIAQATRLAAREGLGERLHFVSGDAHDFTLDEPADLIAMNRALHHVWEVGGATFIARLRDNLRPGGAAVIWEPDWPADRATLRIPAFQGLAFQNLTEHVQGNHLLRAEEIADAFAAQGMAPEIFHFGEGQEAIIVARKPG